jgi:hypothetical protein
MRPVSDPFWAATVPASSKLAAKAGNTRRTIESSTQDLGGVDEECHVVNCCDLAQAEMSDWQTVSVLYLCARS